MTSLTCSRMCPYDVYGGIKRRGWVLERMDGIGCGPLMQIGCGPLMRIRRGHPAEGMGVAIIVVPEHYCGPGARNYVEAAF